MMVLNFAKIIASKLPDNIKLHSLNFKKQTLLAQNGLQAIMNNSITFSSDKKIYFASDNHLGAPNFEESLPRERKFVSWLDHVKKDAAAIFLVGDLFDFFFDYKTVVPKGFTRVLGKLAEITDSGIQYTFL